MDMMYIAAAALVILGAAAVLYLRNKDMPIGLQVFDASGNTVLDTADRLNKVVGEVDINPSASRTNTSGTVTADFGECTLWYIITYVYMGSAPPPSNNAYQIYLPVLTQTASGFSWAYDVDFSDEWDFPAGVHIIYGVY